MTLNANMLHLGMSILVLDLIDRIGSTLLHIDQAGCHSCPNQSHFRQRRKHDSPWGPVFQG